MQRRHQTSSGSRRPATPGKGDALTELAAEIIATDRVRDLQPLAR